MEASLSDDVFNVQAGWLDSVHGGFLNIEGDANYES